jgi:hypothetical protein
MAELRNSSAPCVVSGSKGWRGFVLMVPRRPQSCSGSPECCSLLPARYQLVSVHGSGRKNSRLNFARILRAVTWLRNDQVETHGWCGAASFLPRGLCCCSESSTRALSDAKRRHLKLALVPTLFHRAFSRVRLCPLLAGQFETFVGILASAVLLLGLDLRFQNPAPLSPNSSTRERLWWAGD